MSDLNAPKLVVQIYHFDWAKSKKTGVDDSVRLLHMDWVQIWSFF